MTKENAKIVRTFDKTKDDVVHSLYGVDPAKLDMDETVTLTITVARYLPITRKNGAQVIVDRAAQPDAIHAQKYDYGDGQKTADFASSFPDAKDSVRVMSKGIAQLENGEWTGRRAGVESDPLDAYLWKVGQEFKRPARKGEPAKPDACKAVATQYKERRASDGADEAKAWLIEAMRSMPSQLALAQERMQADIERDDSAIEAEAAAMLAELGLASGD